MYIRLYIIYVSYNMWDLLLHLYRQSVLNDYQIKIIIIYYLILMFLLEI